MADVTAGTAYTAADFCQAAKSEGLAASPRLLRAWVGLGLLDAPKRLGRGRCKGSALGTWPFEQLQVFLTLIRQRQPQGVKRDAVLCNTVVLLWLYVGGAYAPLRQVRRAMATYSKAARTTGWEQAVSRAEATTCRIAAHGVRRGVRLRAKQALAQMGSSGILDKALLRDVLRDVMDPDRTQAPPGSEGAQLTPEAIVDLFAARFGVAEPSVLKGIPDEIWNKARDRVRFGHGDGERSQATFTAALKTGKTLEKRSGGKAQNSACLDLLTALGQLWNTPSEPKAISSAPSKKGIIQEIPRSCW